MRMRVLKDKIVKQQIGLYAGMNQIGQAHSMSKTLLFRSASSKITALLPFALSILVFLLYNMPLSALYFFVNDIKRAFLDFYKNFGDIFADNPQRNELYA